MSRLVATFFHVGRLRPAPGTWGSLAALPLGWILHGLAGFPALAGATAVLFALGLWAVAREGGADRPEYVVDEVVGQWIALWPLSAGLWAAGAAPWLFPWPGWVGAFLAFRLVDIWKPWPISRIDARGTALAVMLDDVAAGLAAALVVAAAAAVAHGALMV
jgi:phosphatidylglycerophosphatase A